MAIVRSAADLKEHFSSQKILVNSDRKSAIIEKDKSDRRCICCNPYRKAIARIGIYEVEDSPG